MFNLQSLFLGLITKTVNFKMLHVLICKKAVKLDGPIKQSERIIEKTKPESQIMSSLERIISSGIMPLFIYLFTKRDTLYLDEVPEHMKVVFISRFYVLFF